MKRFHLRSRHVALLLLIVSVMSYGVEYVLTGNIREITAGFLGNFAFLPIYVLFVTLIIERVLKERERLTMRRKLNMVIGVFYSEVGTGLIRGGAEFLADRNGMAERLQIDPQWQAGDFERAAAQIFGHDLRIVCRRDDLPRLKEFLVARRRFMLGLLENPNLLEHDDFTDLLWAVFHLTEELAVRNDLTTLPDSDLEHLSGDIKRALVHTLREWLVYMRHLQHDYPYLFSLAVRMNPLNPASSAEVA